MPLGMSLACGNDLFRRKEDSGAQVRGSSERTLLRRSARLARGGGSTSSAGGAGASSLGESTQNFSGLVMGM